MCYFLQLLKSLGTFLWILINLYILEVEMSVVQCTTSRKHVWDLFSFVGLVGFNLLTPSILIGPCLYEAPLSHIWFLHDQRHVFPKHVAGIKVMVCDTKWLFSMQNILVSESKWSHSLDTVGWLSAPWANQPGQSWGVPHHPWRAGLKSRNYSQAWAESVWLTSSIHLCYYNGLLAF